MTDPASAAGSPPPVLAPDPVRPVTAADRAWADLAAQLTPAASMARIDTVTARAVTTITVIGLLTGLGALGADRFAKDGGAATALAVAAVIVASLAVACALAAQVLTISRLNPANLEQVRAWYHRLFTVRARATQAATLLLILAALLAGATAATALLTAPAQASTATPSR